MRQSGSQKDLSDVTYVRLQKGGKRFEITCYRNKVLSWRSKVETDINEVLQIDSVFTDVSTGMLANVKDIHAAFGTTDKNLVCIEILSNGDIYIHNSEQESIECSYFVVDKLVNGGTSAASEKATPTAVEYEIDNLYTRLFEVGSPAESPFQKKQDDADYAAAAAELDLQDADAPVQHFQETPGQEWEEEMVAVPVNEGLLAQLLEMGFPDVRARKSLVHGGSLDGAMSWLADHQDDEDIDQPYLVKKSDTLPKPPLSEDREERMRLLREIAAESAAENKELLKGMVCGPGCALTPVCMYSRDKIGRMGYRIFFDCPFCLKAGIHCPVGFHRSTCLDPVLEDYLIGIYDYFQQFWSTSPPLDAALLKKKEKGF